MGCWDTVCYCCSVAVDAPTYPFGELHYHEWTCKKKAVLRIQSGWKVYDCEQMLQYGGTGEFIANGNIYFSVGTGWSEYPKYGVVVHSDCLDLFISIYGPVLDVSDQDYSGNFHLERLWYMKSDIKSIYHSDEHYKEYMFRLESPAVSPENKAFISHRLKQKE